MSERVALRLVLPGVVVTWIVTGFPDTWEGRRSASALLEACSLQQDKLTVAGE